MSPEEKDVSRNVENDSDSQLSDERREFLKKCGKYTAYTAPVIAGLLLFRTRAEAKSGPY